MEAAAAEIGIQKYEAYKDSGVQWLGEVPAHWEVVRSKALFHERKEKARKNDKQLTASQKYGMIGQEEFMEKEGRRVTVVVLDRDILKHIEANDFVISMRSFQGGLEYSTQSGCVSSAYIPLIPIKHVVPAYFKYLFKSDGYIKALSSTSNLVRDGQAMRFENFAAVPLLIIPEEEQTAIADLLDRKTAQIDTAIVQKERLIELLQERRQILIQRAVTRCRNLDAPTKDSGVEWLGEIPAHWEVKKLKHLTTAIVDGTHFTPNYLQTSDGVPFLRVTDIQTPIIDPSNVKHISREEHRELTKRCKPAKGDILLSKNGTIGLTKVVDWDWEFSLFVSICLIKPLPVLNPYFFSYFFQSNVVGTQLQEGSKTTSVTNLHLEKIRELLLLLPPTGEQAAIVAHLDSKTAWINKAIAHKLLEIDKLREYKSILINAAVTGKIKVS